MGSWAGVPPARLLAALRGARKVVEVGAGPRFEVALALARELPGCEVLVVDTDPRVLAAPSPLRGEVDDVTAPRLGLYEGAALLYGVRLPEDLHAPAARLARRVGATLALRLLGDEVPALPGWGPGEVLADAEGAWHLWRPGARRP